MTRTLLEADASRRRRDEVVDKMAAAYILQGALDRLRQPAMSDSDSAPARFLWLLRPPVPIDRRTERIFLLVGCGGFFRRLRHEHLLAWPRRRSRPAFHIPENQIGADHRLFPLAAVFALLIAASADLVGRRRLLLVTIFGQAVFTLLTAFAAGLSALSSGRSSSPACSAMPRRCCASW